MLTTLSVKNYALIENITIDFKKGLTVITGETGAGKSIIMDSIDLLLGERASTSIIRTGAAICIVTAEFNISSNTNVKNILSELSIDVTDEIIIRRQIDVSGKSKAFINDVSVSVNTLSNIGKHLVDFYAQHKSNMLFEQNYQRKIVDDMANNDSLLEQLSEKYDEFEKLKKCKEEIEKANTDRERLLDLYKYQINEINKANLNSDEEGKIDQELPKLKNAEKIKTVTNEMLSILYKQDHSVTDNLSIINKQISLLEKYGVNVETVSENINSAISQIDDAYREIEDLSNKLDASPEMLDSMQERQQLIKKLKSKYGKTIQEIIDYGEQLEEKVKNLENYDVNMDKIQKEIEVVLKEIIKICTQISDKRKKVAKKISKVIVSELEDLNMKNSQFEIDIKEGDISRTGFDDLEFMFSANKGETLYPLSDVASGGEISRVLLALSTAISENYNVDTIVFDEIDTGTSGKTGEKIGKKLKSLSKDRQIISISHLAQIASNADNHIKIYKELENGRNITKAKVLNEKERIEEIAKIISGEKVTEHARKHAEELLNDK